MRFHKIPFVKAAPTNPSPRTSPASVPGAQVIDFGAMGVGQPTVGDFIPQRLMLALEGTTAETATVEVWIQDDFLPNDCNNFADVPTSNNALRKFYLCNAGGTVVTVGQTTELTSNVPVGGTVYFRLIVEPAHDATLLAALA